MARGRKTGGRQKGSFNKDVTSVRHLAQPYGPEAIQVLVDAMRNTEKPELSVNAAQQLLDRAYGRPTNSTEISGKDGAPVGLKVNVHFVNGDKC